MLDVSRTHSCSTISICPLLPASEWEHIHVDYAKINGKGVLVRVDAGSRWIEGAKLSNTNTLATLKQMFVCFMRFGFPKRCHPVNEPQLSNCRFKSKLWEWRASLSRSFRTVKEMIRKNPCLSLDTIFFSYTAAPLA
ncbi:unnamed protein product [Lepeophtheirus salmonis]|uniref:(salmon louse) hypothetical protein n=1 Tax=Lepeophtheirus salmonis TaxID=72036 RepID=A0A7R8CRV7_LEPSM|nr:unnamed protein product [Lepeophtheirus salmonis]CAF2910454.1 unnamed protein product [Lepeophtheirus salmonis]